MDRVAVTFLHCGQKVTLKALIKFEKPFLPLLTDHRCNSYIDLTRTGYMQFCMFFIFGDTYSYKVFGHIHVQSIELDYICPFNTDNGLHEPPICQEQIISKENW